MKEQEVQVIQQAVKKINEIVNDLQHHEIELEARVTELEDTKHILVRLLPPDKRIEELLK